MELAKKQTATQSQKLMVFVLTMALYGLATLFTELIPSFQVGIVEFSVEYFLFIPLTLAMLFDPLSAALGAATGELVFSEIMLGQFGGLGELEKFLTVTIGVYVAGRMVKNPRNYKMVGIAAISGTALQLAMGAVVDICKVQFAVEDFEAVAGLPESSWCPSSTGRLSPCWACPPARRKPGSAGSALRLCWHVWWDLWRLSRPSSSPRAASPLWTGKLTGPAAARLWPSVWW